MPTRPQDSQDTGDRAGTDADARRDRQPDRPREQEQEQEQEHNHDQDHGGYAERGPGRGDHPARPPGERVDRQSPAEREASDRSRWRSDDRDERSERWSGKDGPEKQSGN